MLIPFFSFLLALIALLIIDGADVSAVPSDFGGGGRSGTYKTETKKIQEVNKTGRSGSY